ncbi:hypothetical protein [Synechococcus elongatus]|uniref:hypothetical protein n=1 Tax=Synechococcus elongatus TaxID=32046 RepID=UPI0030D0A4E6
MQDRPAHLGAWGYSNFLRHPKRFSDWQFLCFDRQAPDLPNLRTILDPLYRPVDFMPSATGCFVKPGYGTFSEAAESKPRSLLLTRAGFAEAELLLQGLQAIAPHAILSPEVCVGDWSVLKDPPQPPLQALPWQQDGNRQIAEAIGGSAELAKPRVPGAVGRKAQVEVP